MANLEKISSLFIKDTEGNLIEKYSIKDEDSSNKSESNENGINKRAVYHYGILPCVLIIAHIFSI